MTKRKYEENLYFAKFQGRKSVFCQILRVKNLYNILKKSVLVAGLFIYSEWAAMSDEGGTLPKREMGYE